MKAILLDEAKKWLEENCENQYTRMAVFGIMQSMPTVDYQKTPNEPLTLEQLREMDEVPIYVVTEKRGKGWCILSWHGVNKSFTFFSKTGTSEGMTAVPLSASTYGDRWLAYRRPPENDTESPFENNKSKFMEE